jgi:hypothetical protein
MVIDNLNVICVSACPTETNPPLVVDSDAVLAGSIASKRFQAIAGRGF